MRCDTDELDAALRRALAAYFVEGMPAPPNYSLQLSRGEGNASQRLRTLHRAHMMVIRTRWRSRALRGLLSYMDEFLPRPPGLQEVQALALVKDGRAYLVPQPIEVWLELLSSPLHRAGFQFVDLQSVRVDLEARELVVPEWLLEVDAGALQDLQRSEGGAREPGAVSPGRYPIEAWAFFQTDGQPAPSAESTLLQLFQSMANPFDLGVPATLRTLESFAAGVRVGNLGSPPYHDSLAARITALAVR